jgi:hypothetical protein
MLPTGKTGLMTDTDLDTLLQRYDQRRALRPPSNHPPLPPDERSVAAATQAAKDTAHSLGWICAAGLLLIVLLVGWGFVADLPTYTLWVSRVNEGPYPQLEQVGTFYLKSSCLEAAQSDAFEALEHHLVVMCLPNETGRH